MLSCHRQRQDPGAYHPSAGLGANAPDSLIVEQSTSRVPKASHVRYRLVHISVRNIELGVLRRADKHELPTSDREIRRTRVQHAGISPAAFLIGWFWTKL